MRIISLLILLLGLACLPVHANQAIFQAGERGIFQIRVIQRDTANKASIGSGFIAGRPDILVTNYHVVEQTIHRPEHYRLEVMLPNGNLVEGQLLDIDIIHDLAILRTPLQVGSPFELGEPPAKGGKLFSMGNPLDLGLTLSESTNNGPLEGSESERLLLSGTLNPGMSGGPTFDTQGRVVGVNVAITGDELSLIIPGEFVEKLLARVQHNGYSPAEDLLGSATQQIIAHLDRRNQRLIGNDFPLTGFGDARVPAAIDPTVSCWDGSSDFESGDFYRHIELNCSGDSGVYVSSEREFGVMEYEYIIYQAEGISDRHFMRLYETENDYNLHNDSDPESHTPFACQNGFLTMGAHAFKASLCRRDYRKYSGLSDLFFSAALVGEPGRGMFISGGMLGVPYTSSLGLIQRLVESIEWKE